MITVMSWLNDVDVSYKKSNKMLSPLLSIFSMHLKKYKCSISLFFLWWIPLPFQRPPFAIFRQTLKCLALHLGELLRGDVVSCQFFISHLALFLQCFHSSDILYHKMWPKEKIQGCRENSLNVRKILYWR